MRFDLIDQEKEKLLSLFKQHEQNIDYLLYLRDTIWCDANIESSLFNNKNTFEKRMLFIDELLKNKKSDSDFVNKTIRWDTNLIDIKTFLHNPYLKALENVSFIDHHWSLEHKKMKAYTLFPYEEEYHYGSNYTLKMNLGFFDMDYTYPTLSLFDHEWMSLNPYEIRTMEIAISTAKGKVLTLGLGLGYFAYMVHLKEDVKEVHIVEMDVDLIKAFNQYLLPLFPYPEKIHIHKADAFYFINDIKDKDYDFIFSDLWHDVSDGLPAYIKLKQAFKGYSSTKIHYWIEGSVVSYLRLLTIGVMKDEYYHLDNEYDGIQLTIKKSLENIVIKKSYDLDSILNIQGLQNLFLIKN